MTSLVQRAFVSRFVYNSLSLSKITEITAMLPTKDGPFENVSGGGGGGAGEVQKKKTRAREN